MSIEPSIKINEIINEVEKVIVGKRHVVKLSLTALLAGGHVLLEDVPGVGKTMMVRTLAKTIGVSFKRIQFTPDLLPADVTGVSIFNPETREFEFRPGPVMGNIVLADEINRTAPRTQAALLEGMAENSVTVDGITRKLADPFFVMATQNPIEYEGTYALPEAQLDRFLLKINIGYPTVEEEMQLLTLKQYQDPLDQTKQVVTLEELLNLKSKAKQVFIDDVLKNYIIRLVDASRKHPSVSLGISPRGSLAFMQAAQAFALIEGRDYVIPDDIQYLAPYIFTHRLILKSEAYYNEETAESIIASILKNTSVPVEKR
ncbi:MoxR family ATPase [Listeria swaminathanii]|uniref:MoxR family ATPase n=1 Tax=Listeria swaminathanii TaxID=2713501 RepID=A0ABU2IE18_9LIST|nr:MoxR family ATPase [Listeria swaminathanii]MDT0015787.1 MoxR family ATPase [Listeria swaminathanii]MDT0021223.1 MoxR family ATPase [Listeria swaminathanii]MDT0032187.1 MoxR family ATPase [Listeria swaminathanii]MDT0051963.1 MoxR family ATPase [Listeria swaminathanii]MDT0054728.1 MoxR family ATPase [Listeria swaminathanii]